MRGLLAIEILYHAIVAGKKTQTRRSGGLEKVNGRKATKTKKAIITTPDEWEKASRTIYTDGTLSEQWFMKKGGGIINYVNGSIGCKPRYRVGEVLYLKEPWVFLESKTTDFWNGYAYKFGARSGCAISERGAELGGTEIKFKNKLFMPASAARAYIRITGIKCERLMDISDADCIAEGIQKTGYGYKNYSSKTKQFELTEKGSFISLFQFANKMKPTAELPNIWCWAYTFEYLPNYNPNN